MRVGGNKGLEALKKLLHGRDAADEERMTICGGQRDAPEIV
jgi:hypothetical protein